ncbi:hypothetical protein FHL15_006286 [Xylaria flabelliformis]|uniref:Major facilitator superfamily (MFS) profile domain-containing protein n=1 Tax=Xylaria flabelliformis TaxID=2512241 RepID=A0A553HY48_9PEZI|nr:hypothetical protein FHL15_006286 [Xylaria flabelliformis]
MEVQAPASASVERVGNETSTPPSEAPKSTSDTVYPSAWRQVIIVLGLLSAVFLSGLDISIISNAIPSITADFNSLGDVGWYGSAFFLADAAFQSPWAKAYKYFDLKWVFLATIFVFEVGCLIAALAPSSTVLIVGRTIQGSGAAGILLGSYSIANFVCRPDKVPLVVGLIGTVFSISSVIGPIIGGVFAADPHLTWRWCFWINLPIGGIPLILIVLFFRTPPQAKIGTKSSATEIAASFDLLGAILFIGGLIAFILATTWGGVKYAWSSSTIIGLLVGSILITIAFVANEFWQNERALIVVRVLKNRDMWVNCLWLFFFYGPYFVIVYNLPTYLQATAGISPRDSGFRTIPLIASTSVFSLVGAVAVGKYGKYSLFMLFGSVVTTIAGGLIYTFDVDTGIGKQIGYQILLGLGVGPVIQIPPIVAGIVNKNADKPLGLGAVLVTQFGVASIVISAASSITNNLLINSLPRLAPGVDPAQVLGIGPSDLQAHFEGDQLLGVRKAYVVGLRGAWALAIALWGFSALMVAFSKWPGHMIPAKEDDASDEQAETKEPSAVPEKA